MRPSNFQAKSNDLTVHIGKGESIIDGSAPTGLLAKNIPHFTSRRSLTCVKFNKGDNQEIKTFWSKVPFWPGQNICTPTACIDLSRPARPKVCGSFHRFRGKPEWSWMKFRNLKVCTYQH